MLGTKTKDELLYTFERDMFYGLKETMSDEQEAYVKSILTTPLVFSNSKAGTGKTLMAYAALYYLKEKGIIDKIIYIFSPVSEGKMGFRPGTQQEKSLDYSAPVMNAVKMVADNPFTETDEMTGETVITSHTFLRGDTLDRAGVIIDEPQNFTAHELKKTLTRITDTCHTVLSGHTGQIDLPNPRSSGFKRYMEHFAAISRDKVAYHTLTHNYRGWLANHADTLEATSESPGLVHTIDGGQADG